MPQPARALFALVVAGLLLSGPAMAQSVGPARAAGRTTTAAGAPLVIEHSFPLAGGPLVLCVSGLSPGEDVALEVLKAAEAPQSVIDFWREPNDQQSTLTTVNGEDLFSIWHADENGRVAFSIPLKKAEDVDRELHLKATALLARGATRVAQLSLRVQPPMLVLAGAAGLQRISLLTGALLTPALPAAGGMRGFAYSDDGNQGWLLREGGRLELLPAHQWDAAPLSVRLLDPAADLLAGHLGGGAAFVLARPAGDPFAPAASLVFMEDGRSPVVLESMSQPVAGRRVALSGDGFTAFLAEDDLIVREVDLLTGSARGLMTAGFAGDLAIADMLMAGRKLMVATRGPLGRQGALTVFDLDSGALDTLPLQVDPLRLVALAGGSVLVVPATGAAFQMVEGGLPGRLVSAPGIASWLDAAPSGAGALLLGVAADGRRPLQQFDPQTGRFIERLARAPAATRLVGASSGNGPVVLLGDPAGAVHVFDPEAGSLAAAVGVSAGPDAAFVVVP